MTRTQRDGLLLIILASTGYAVLPIIAKNIYALSDLGPIDVAIWRFIFAVPIWLGIAVRGTPEEKLPRGKLLLLGVFFSGAALSAFAGLATPLPASTFTVLFFSYPALVALIGTRLGERLSPIGWGALALTMIGVILTVPNFGELGAADPSLRGGLILGVGLAMVNAAIVAVYFTLVGRMLRGYTAVARASGWVMTGTLGVMLILALMRGVVVPADLQTWLSLGALGVVSTAIPIFFMMTGISKLGAPRAAIVSTIQPLLTVLLAVVFLSEVIHPLQMLGGALIIASIVLLEGWRGKHKKTHPASSPLAGD